MAKALIGYLDSDLRPPARLAAENVRLRSRVGELETLVLRLQAENDRLQAQVHASDAAEELTAPEMLPA